MQFWTGGGPRLKTQTGPTTVLHCLRQSFHNLLKVRYGIDSPSWRFSKNNSDNQVGIVY